jgi:perosamine synthetase
VFVVGLPREVDRDGLARVFVAMTIHSTPYLPAIHLMSFHPERVAVTRVTFPVFKRILAATCVVPETSKGQLARVAHHAPRS